MPAFPQRFPSSESGSDCQGPLPSFQLLFIAVLGQLKRILESSIHSTASLIVV